METHSLIIAIRLAFLLLSTSALQAAEGSGLITRAFDGAPVANVRVTLAEGAENVTFALQLKAGFALGSGSLSTTLSLGDNEPAPSPLALGISSPGSSLYELTLTGIADRRCVIEASGDLLTWFPLTEIVTDTVPKRLTDSIETPQQFYRARYE